jgi:protein O-mannosyl-transferase
VAAGRKGRQAGDRSDRNPERPGRARTFGGLGRLRAPVWVAFLLAILAYLPALGHGFVWDDVTFIEGNSAAHRIADLPSSLGHGYGWVPSGAAGPDASLYYRPLVTFTNTVTWVLSAGRPWLFHLHNVLTHAVSAALLALLALGLGLSPGAALLAAGVFAVHPVLSESVAWISGRTDLFAGVFTLATLVLLRAWRTGGLPRRAGGAVPWPAGITFFLALVSKESAAALIVLAPMVAIWPVIRDRSPLATVSLRRAGVVLGTALALYALLRFSVLGAGGLGGHGVLPMRGSLPDRLLLGGALMLTYIGKVVFPWHLAPEPPAILAGGRAPIGLGLAGLVLLAALFALWVRSLGRGLRGVSERPVDSLAFSTGLGLFLFGLLPALQWISTGEIYGERFLYLPLAGLLLAAGACVNRWVARSSARPVVALALVGLPLATVLELRLPDWKDEPSLFRQAARTHPQSARALANYGLALGARGQAEDALLLLERAVRLDPGDPWKRGQYGAMLVTVGRSGEGVDQLETVYAAGVRSKTLLKNLGIALSRAGRYEEAVERLNAALNLDPSDATVYDALGMAQRKRGRWDEAARSFARAVELDPSRKGAWLNLIGMLYQESGEVGEAREWATRFLERFPTAVEAKDVRTLMEAHPVASNRARTPADSIPPAPRDP